MCDCVCVCYVCARERVDLRMERILRKWRVKRVRGTSSHPSSSLPFFSSIPRSHYYYFLFFFLICWEVPFSHTRAKVWSPSLMCPPVASVGLRLWASSPGTSTLMTMTACPLITNPQRKCLSPGLGFREEALFCPAVCDERAQALGLSAHSGKDPRGTFSGLTLHTHTHIVQCLFSRC